MRTIFYACACFLALSGFGLGANEMNNDQGLKIVFDQELYNETKNFRVQGVLSTFVNCGSQYATWRQFPQAIQYKLINLVSGDIYISIDGTLSISESGNKIYDYYSKQPCNQVVSQDFFVDLNQIYFQNAPKSEILNFELQAEYVGHKSNILKFTKKPFHITSF